MQIETDGKDDSVPWDNLREFTEPNGRFEENSQGTRTFVPKYLPPDVAYDHEMIRLLTTAERRMGELNGRGDGLENPHVLIRAYLKREAVLSSKIEGTLATIKDLNIYEVTQSMNQESEKSRLNEVVNYVNALERSIGWIKEPGREIDQDVIKDAHKILMSGVRGYDQNPGELRSVQNWIMRVSGTRRTVIYTPPPASRIAELVSDLVEFIRKDHGGISPLIQCAIMHQQFESIHPFLDGNGRIGRLLIPLVMHKKSLLSEPLLYLSAFFDKYREEYYNGLLLVNQKSAWGDWIKFFLRAIIEQAEEAISTIKKLYLVEKKYAKTLHSRNARSNALRLMSSLFENPYTTIPRAQHILGVTYPTARKAVTTLIEANILERAGVLERKGARRPTHLFRAAEIEDALDVRSP